MTKRRIYTGWLWGVLLTLYVAVAALNYSVVQSYLGAAAGRMFSSQWGGTVRIGSLHAMPWDHLMADNVLMVAPDGDTILDVKHLRVHFRRFPYSKMHLELDRVSLRDGYYHLAITHVPEVNTVYDVVQQADQLGYRKRHCLSKNALPDRSG